MMMPHGIPRTAATSSAALRTRRNAEAANADRPRLTSSTRTPKIHPATTTSVTRWRLVSANDGSALAAVAASPDLTPTPRISHT